MKSAIKAALATLAVLHAVSRASDWTQYDKARRQTKPVETKG